MNHTLSVIKGGEAGKEGKEGKETRSGGVERKRGEKNREEPTVAQTDADRHSVLTAAVRFSVSDLKAIALILVGLGTYFGHNGNTSPLPNCVENLGSDPVPNQILNVFEK